MRTITASIVTYNNEISEIELLLRCILEDEIQLNLYVIDNSPTDYLRDICQDARINYIYLNENVGFGAAHNIAINEAIKNGSKYHFVINPDICFDKDVLKPMVHYMDNHPDIGMMMPKILYPDGEIQYLPKLIPSPSDMIFRKMRFAGQAYERFIKKYELRDLCEHIFSAPLLSGCFTLLRLNAIKELGGYDERFFMYFEDFDLSRRIHKKYKTIYYPEVSVYHDYASGANKNKKLFLIFVKSAIKYFNKWGWFYDKERKKLNKRAYRNNELIYRNAV